jgi:hypothetical protein
MPSNQPQASPTSLPSSQPTNDPTTSPTDIPSSQPSSQPISKPTALPSTAPSPKPTPLPTQAPTRISKPYGYLLLDQYALSDTQCRGNYAFYAIGVGVCSYNETSRSYYSMYSVFVNKVSITATISKYNGTLCSGGASTSSQTFSKGTCALASGSQSLFNLPHKMITNTYQSAFQTSNVITVFSTATSASFSTSIPAVSKGLMIK